jgi:predicted nucleotide-binding protein (sugar kinase/HSP70/actin superfamily)
VKENCDRGCQINVIRLDGKSLPFGGICNKYYNLAHHVDIDPQPYDYVEKRQQALFRAGPFAADGTSAIACRGRDGVGRLAADGTSAQASQTKRTIGLTRSFLTHLLYPLYDHFFSRLGFEVVLPDAVDPEGVRRTCASFCYPAEIAHGWLHNLAGKRPDYIFLPQVCELHVEKCPDRFPGHQCTCIALQGEPYYLRSAFPDVPSTILSPILNFSAGWHSMEGEFVKLAQQLGCDKQRATAAYGEAVAQLEAFFWQRKELGRQVLRELEQDPGRVGIVLFGRPYNTFAAEANMGIPRKFASRGVYGIPFDCLPFCDEPSWEKMTWAIGHDLMRAARFVKKHAQLFGAFVTNFSCGPDSFVVGYFRDIMQTKPSLTLEIDNHTADAGVNTRVEAFLDIIERYRKLRISDPPQAPFRRAEVVISNGKSLVIASDGSRCALKDARVKVLIPSMGRTLSELAAAAFRGLGIRAECVPLPDFQTLMLGRANTSCKECLPLLLTTGSLLEYLKQHRRQDELLLYFMPTTNGNCRFSQYHVYLNRLIEKKRIENVATFSLTSANSYGGMGAGNVGKLLKGIVVGDVMDDIHNALAALAVDAEAALHVFRQQWQLLLDCFARGCKGLNKLLRQVALRLAAMRLKQPLAEAKRVLLAGEIFVRKDEFSSQRVVDALARRQIVAQRAPMLEWLRFIDYHALYIDPRNLSAVERFRLKVRTFVFGRIERKIKRILAQSGLCSPEVVDVEAIMDVGEHFVPKAFGGETILAVGRFFKDILRDFHGMISIGPFACLPTRIIQSILTPESKVKDNRRVSELPDSQRLQQFVSLPFLSIECDGNPFPQIIEAQIEAFCLQVERLHRNANKPSAPGESLVIELGRVRAEECLAPALRLAPALVPGEQLPAAADPPPAQVPGLNGGPVGVVPMLEVTTAEYVDGYRICLRFNNGEAGVVDLKDCLWGPMFEPLRDVGLFKRFTVSAVLHTVCWQNDADFAPEFLYEKMLEQSRAADTAAPRR